MEAGARSLSAAQAVRPYARQTRAKRPATLSASKRAKEEPPSPDKRRNHRTTVGSSLYRKGRRDRVPAGASSSPWLHRMAYRPSPWPLLQAPHAVRPRGTANYPPAAEKPQQAVGAPIGGGMGRTACTDCSSENSPDRPGYKSCQATASLGCSPRKALLREGPAPRRASVSQAAAADTCS